MAESIVGCQSLVQKVSPGRIRIELITLIKCKRRRIPAYLGKKVNSSEPSNYMVFKPASTRKQLEAIGAKKLMQKLTLQKVYTTIHQHPTQNGTDPLCSHKPTFVVTSLRAAKIQRQASHSCERETYPSPKGYLRDCFPQKFALAKQLNLLTGIQYC